MVTGYEIVTTAMTGQIMNTLGTVAYWLTTSYDYSCGHSVFYYSPDQIQVTVLMEIWGGISVTAHDQFNRSFYGK